VEARGKGHGEVEWECGGVSFEMQARRALDV